MEKKEVPVAKAILIFLAATVWFFFLLYTLLPWLKHSFKLHPALYWFITAYCLFVPLFIAAVVFVRTEGHKGLGPVLEALAIRPMTKRDWLYAGGGLAVVLLGTGLVFGGSYLLNRIFGLPLIETSPWFMEMRPFAGWEKLFLLIWLPMFFFNIVGEELLWRGYIQNRLKGKHSWLLISLLWFVFHLPFGPGLLAMLVPALLVVPFVFSRTGNALTGILIHGLFNGPVFLAVSLGGF